MATFTVTKANPFYDLPSPSSTSLVAEFFGLQGTVTDVSVSLVGLDHTSPADLVFTLESPNDTRSLVFLSGAGGGTDIYNVNLILSDSATTMPGAVLESGIYKPTGGATFASTFGGIAPNGAWQLEIDDDVPTDEGSLGGWGMTIRTSSNAVVINDAGGLVVVATGANSGFYSLNERNVQFSEVTSFTYNGGIGADTIRGSAFNEVINGGAGNDTLDGGIGIDVMSGGVDGDAYHVDNAGDRVIEAIGGGYDWVSASISYVLAAGQEIELFTTNNAGSASAIDLTGNEFVNYIIGNAGANRIDGRVGADTMEGVGGSDIYLVDNAGDLVLEAVAGGNDRVATGVSYVLAAGQEIELFTTNNAGSTSAINLTGNEFANYIIGNAGANTIDGRGGVDTMQGLGGNDLYHVDNAGDVVLEAVGGGLDRVAASVSYFLTAGQDIEVFTTNNSAGAGAINLTGNAHNQTIAGNAGNNILNGGAGNDILTGLGGKDTFVFNTALNPATNVDTISDFSVVDDAIVLENAVFAGLAVGTLTMAAFRTSAAAADADDRIIYNNVTGQLIFDSNGNAAGGATQFATLAAGLALTNADFVII